MATETFSIYKLHFTTPVHLGDMRDDYGISLKAMASDTMYAALIACLAKQGICIPHDGDLGCTISSLFPFYQESRDAAHILFFPKPMKQSLPTIDKAIEQRKKIKKIAWLDLAYFNKTLNGTPLFNKENISTDIHGEYLTDSMIDDHFISSQVSARVSVSRTGDEEARPFYMDRVMFKGYSGLFFIVKGNTELLDKAMALLQHEGIGTDRNVGNGYFEYDTDTLEIDIPQASGFTMSLSSFIPESSGQLNDMLNSEAVAYDFQRRGGWITTPPHNTLRKNVIHAFSAASVFKKDCKGVEIMGRVGVDLCPTILKDTHPVWRCGRALFIPIILT